MVAELWVGVEGSRLELAYASESWTEVRDGADRLLFHGAPTPGTRLVVRGEAFALLLGYAPEARSYNKWTCPCGPCAQRHRAAGAGSLGLGGRYEP